MKTWTFILTSLFILNGIAKDDSTYETPDSFLSI